ncbi:hypothetical protein [Zooshikella ganghwensis]|uniref:Uncharacterized protein n=1 Tax=Zooshikella ganghwensis TaxID=202772 RepID=A0A4P9VJL3_9GAMM|nr:hypothetical protein [Zooshikella ganghwensis]RDH43465.1 hypothetical protein B9G39_08450 [Zooshikella ganghwensis]
MLNLFVQINKRALLILLLVASSILGFFKWAVRGLADPLYEYDSPNGKFKVVVYQPSTLTEPYELFGKLYENETGKFIAESQYVLSERLYWDIGGDDEVHIGVDKIFDLKELETHYNSFTK